MITIGVIGLGFGKNIHVPAFRNDSRCLVDAIAGSSKEKAGKVAKMLNIRKYYGDYSFLLNDPEIQAVSIAVPPNLQGMVIEDAIANRKHIFCEKPLGCGSSKGKALAELAAKNRLVTVVDFEFPELNVWRKAKEFIETQKLGKIMHIAVDWHLQTYTNMMRISSWKSNQLQMGGTLYNFISHVFYNIECLSGPISDLCCKIYPMENQLVQIMLAFSKGHSGSISVSTNTPFAQKHTIEVFCEKGRLVLQNSGSDYLANFSLQIFSNIGMQNYEDPVSSASDGRIPPTARLVRAFIDAIERPNSLLMAPSLSDGARVETLLEYSVISNKSNQWTQIPI